MKLMFLDETRMVVKKARSRSLPRTAEDGFFEEGTSTPSCQFRLLAQPHLHSLTFP